MIEEIKILQEKGYVVVKNAWPKIEDFVKNIDIEKLSTESEFGNIFMCEHGPKQIQHLEKIDKYRDVGEKLKSYFGGGRILNMQIFIKYPGYKITAPHQDGAYFNSDKNIITFWIPLQDVSEENSCMYYKVGSHKQGLREHTKSGTTIRTRTGVTGYSLECYDEPLEDFEAVPMKLGDVLLHDQYTLHYSSTNHSNEKRMALTCILELSNI